MLCLLATRIGCNAAASGTVAIAPDRVFVTAGAYAGKSQRMTIHSRLAVAIEQRLEARG